MGFCYYLLNTEKKIALEVSRNIDELDSDNYEVYEMLIEYFNEGDIKLDVVEYLVKKCYGIDYDVMSLVYVMKQYNFSELVNEDKLPKGYITLNY